MAEVGLTGEGGYDQTWLDTDDLRIVCCRLSKMN